MGVSIFGIGYVGAVTSACISKSGFPVTAVDINPEKVDRLGRGESPIVEPGLPELLKAGIYRSEEHTSELQSLMRISYAVFCLKKKKNTKYNTQSIKLVM